MQLEEKTKDVPDRHFPPIMMDNPIRRLFSPPEKKISEFVAEGDVVADIGSGPGYYTIAIAKMVGRRGKVYAIDSDENALEKIREKAARFGLSDRIITVKASASDMKMIPDNSVDFALSNGVICCMADHLAAVKEMSRIMKPSALAYVEVSRHFTNDPRSVSEKEWRQLLDGFNVLKEGKNIFSRWAVVRRDSSII